MTCRHSVHKDKVALIAGGGGGIGLQTALDLLNAGAQVTVIDLKSMPEDLVGQGGVTFHQGDATDQSFLDSVFKDIETRHGHLDYLANCTGVLWFGTDVSFLDIDFDVWDKVFEINMKSLMMTTRGAVPLMRKAGGGSIVHISSIDALSGDDAPQDAYGAAKASLIRFSKSVAIQCAKDKIRSNSILPGGVHTPLQERWDAAPEKKEALANYVPLGRVGEAEDIANAILFLLSDKASYITGTELIIDGGIRALP